jgi:hypothetical protein
VAEQASQEWSPERVRELLLRQADSSGLVRANVFLEREVPASEIESAVGRAIEAAAKRCGRTAAVRIQRVHALAKSAGLLGDAEVIAAMAGLAGIRAILPAQVEDPYPRPLRKRRLS